MHLETLAPKTKLVLAKLGRNDWLKNYYLAGGTSLALQFGHRQSVDLDFFTTKTINTNLLIKKISRTGSFKLLKEEENTVEGILDGVKVSFMTYPYIFLKKTLKFDNNVNLASATDIALMKLNAIAGRNAKKDFIDLYYFLDKGKKDLFWLFAQMKNKYKGLDYDVMHLYKSLVYFVEADKEPMPKMLCTIDWPWIKNFFIKEVKKITSG